MCIVVQTEKNRRLTQNAVVVSLKYLSSPCFSSQTYHHLGGNMRLAWLSGYSTDFQSRLNQYRFLWTVIERDRWSYILRILTARLAILVGRSTVNFLISLAQALLAWCKPKLKVVLSSQRQGGEYALECIAKAVFSGALIPKSLSGQNHSQRLGCGRV